MEIGYKRQMNQSFMTVQDQFESREVCELQMLANNGIPALLPVELQIADGEICYWYNITGYQSLADYLARKQLNMEILLLLLSGLGELYRQLGEYLLAEGPLLLKEEYIFLDFAGKGLAFTYVPGWEEEPADAFQALMEHLLQQLDHKDRRAVETGYEMYQMSLQRELPLEEMLKQVLHKYTVPGAVREESGTLPHAAEPVRSAGPVEEQIVDWPGGAIGKEWPGGAIGKERPGGAIGKERPGGSIRKERTWAPETGGILDKLSRFHRKEGLARAQKPAEEPVFMTGQEEPAVHPTELLCEHGQIQGRLCYQGPKNWQDLTLGKGDFLIGKKRQEVDGYLPERTVSRIHARIEREGEDYYLEDLNSTNGTYLNGERLEYRQKARLAFGDRILFGNVEYRFV